MVLKVYFDSHPSLVPKDQQLLDDVPSSNVTLRVKNTDTLDEYRCETYCNPQFFEKVTRWIKKRKYECKMLNNNSEMELKVEIFKFALQKVPKTDVEILKQEICQMRKEHNEMSGEQKMFRYYFLNVWKERMRIIIAERPELKHELIQTCRNLYDQIKTEGIILMEFGCKVYYLKIQVETGNTTEVVQNLQQAYTALNSAGYPGSTSGGPTPTGGYITPGGITPSGPSG